MAAGLLAEGYVRQGCVQLTFDVFQPVAQRAATADSVLQRLLADGADTFWRSRALLVRLNWRAVPKPTCSPAPFPQGFAVCLKVCGCMIGSHMA